MLRFPDETVKRETRRHTTLHNGGKHGRRTMWLTVLLIARASCEWVEISQHHYRKPTRTHHEYANQTILPHKWSDRNIAVTRIDSSIPNKYGTELDRNVFIESVNSGNKDVVGTVKRVPSVGDIQRVQLPNTPVKSPVLKTDTSDKLYANFEISLENDSELPQRVYKTKQHVDTKANQFEGQESKITFKNYSLVNGDENNHFVTLNTKITNEKENTFYSKGKVNKITENAYEKEPISHQHSETTSHQESIKSSKKPDIVNIHHTSKYNEQNSSPNNKFEYSTLKDDDAPNLNFKDKQASDKGSNTEDTFMKNKANTMETLIKLMKTVADTISQNSHKSLKSKVRYLHELKNSMLNNIENRIDTLWPDDESDLLNGAKRRTRSAHDSARGHVEFPSSESALMTISFLTFAVFLIKLVLQVIQTYKNKTMMVAPLVVATAGRTIVQRLQNNGKINN